MKRVKFLPVLVVIASLLLSACSGSNISTVQSEPTNNAPAAAAPSNSSAQSIPVSVLMENAPTAANPQTNDHVSALQNAYEAIYQNVSPSVVTIEISRQVTTGTEGNQSQIMPTAEGSGFIWDRAGYIVTNNHVVEGAAKIAVTFSNGSSYDAKLVGTDPNTDIAVVQVAGAPASLIKPITIGDSTQVKVGQLVVAIGNPFGLANTMTTGIVSAIGRSIQAGTEKGQNIPSFSIPDVIQTDAAVNPGNSGGVLVDMNGALIGVPSQIESASGSNSGIGFAIPSVIVSRIVPQLISAGTAENSYLGITGTTLTAYIVSMLNLKAGQQGILVVSVASGGPSEKAGLRGATVDASGSPTAAGDVITGIDDIPLIRFEDLVSYLYNSTQPGQLVTLNVLRGSKHFKVKVLLGIQPTK